MNVQPRATARTATLLSIALVLLPALAPSTARADEASVDSMVSELQGKGGVTGLKLSGFADFTYAKYNFTKASGMGALFGDHGAFAVGNLNLYLDAALSERARSLIELRFTYLPHGVASMDATTLKITHKDGSAPDYTDLNRPVNVGGVIIERAWVEYRLDEKLTVRAGHFLTPYGIWNVDHGSPVIVGVLRPFIIGQQLIPEAQMGLEAYGALHVSDKTLVGYHATLSNGRIGTGAQYLDGDGRFGYGARAFLETSALGDLRVGASAYGGSYKSSEFQYGATGVTESVLSRYDELAYGLDARWAYRGLLLTAEYVRNDTKYQAGAPLHADGVTPVPKDSKWGGYVLAGYSLPFAPQVMPFGMLEFFRQTDQLHHEAGMYNNDIYKYTVGANVHVQPNLVVKGSYGHLWRGGKPFAHITDSSSEYFVQTAWAF